MAALMDRMAAASNKIDDAQATQVESMKQLAAAMGTLDVRETVNQLNQVTQSLKILIDKMGDLSKTQQATLDELGKKAATAGTSVQALTGRMKETQQAAQGVNQTKMDDFLRALEEPGGVSKLLLKQLQKLGDYLSKKFPTSWAISAAAISGFKQGIKNVMAIGKGLMGFLGGLLDSLVNIAGAIIAIPFKMFKGLVDIANNAAGGSNELLQAIENIRKEFGALDQTGPKAIFAMATELKGFSDTGLSAWRVFGDMAHRLEEFLKLSQEMGPTFENFAQEFHDNGGALLAWQKGLGLSGEMMGTIGARAKIFGTTMADQLMPIQKQAMDLGKQFGIASKHISRDMVKAMNDVKHFAGATVKEIGQASVYARKLGLELDKITGILDAFETFDSAAENAAKLSQAFGISVDAFKLMEAQDPATQIEMLRKQFAAAGVDASQFNRQQKKLLASTTGLDEKTAQMAFSMKNQGASLDDIKKKSEQAEKKQLSQAEAMEKLADSIERIVMAGGSSMQGGFFDRFFHGFLGGIQASKEFRDIIWNIKRGMLLVEQAGVRLGKAFVEAFPGVKDILGGIAELFSPKKFGALFNGITDELIKFFKGFTKGEYSFSKLMDNLKEKFFDFFNKSEGAGKRVLNGFKEFFLTISKMLGEAIKWISDKMKDVIVWITDVITGKVELGVPGGSGALGFLGDLLAPIAEGLKHAWKVLAPAIWDLLKVLGGKVLNFLQNTVLPAVKPFIPMLAGTLFGPALTRAALAALTTALGKGFIAGAGAIFKKFGPKIAEAAGTVKSAPEAPGSPLPSAGKSEEIIKAGQAAEKGGTGINWAKVKTFLLAVAGVILIGMVAVFAAIILIRKFNIKDAELIEGLKTVGLAALAMVPAALALKIVSKVNVDANTGSGLLAVGLALLAMVGIMGLVYLALKGVDINRMKNVVDVLWELSKVFLAVSLVTLAAMGIGAIIMSTSGLGAIALAAGMTALVAAVAVMGEAAIEIMKKLNEVPMGQGFKEKVDAFTKIMDSITNFGKNIAAILEAVKPSFITLLSGKDDTVERIHSVTEMMKAMIGQPGGSGIIGIIETITKTLQALVSGGPEMLEAAKAFAEILNAMGSLANAMKPPDKLFESVDSMWTTGEDVHKAIDKVTQYAGDTAKNVERLINVFVEKVMPLVQGGLNESQLKASAAVGQLLGSVVSIAQAMSPSPNAIEALKDVTGNIIAHGDDKNLKPENMQALGAYVTQISDGLSKVIPAIISAIEPLLQTMSSWHFSDSDAAATKFIGPLLQQMFIMVQAITAQSSQLAQAKVPNLNVVTFIDKIGDIVPKIFTSINEKMPFLFDSLKMGIENLQKGTKPESLKQGIDVFKSLMDIVGMIPGIITSLTGDAKGGDIHGKGFAMAEVINEVAWFFEKIFKSGVGAGIAPMELISYVLGLPIIKTLAGQKSEIDSLKLLFGLINDVMKVIKDVNSLVSGGTQIAGIGFKMALIMNEIGWFFEKITKSGVGQGDAPLKLISDSLADPIIGKIAGQKAALENLKKAFGNFTDILKSGSDLEAISKSMTKDGIGTALIAINDMVTKAQSLNDALGKLPDLKLDAKLKTLANGMGLGGKFNYEIKAKDVVINMTVKIEMSASDVEKAIVLRKDSVIRDRINFATGSPDKTASTTLPDTATGYTYTPVTAK